MPHEITVLSVLVGIALTLALAELFSRRLDRSDRRLRTRFLRWGTLRAIRLEEPRPGRVIECVPHPEHLDYSDGYLEHRKYSYQADSAGFIMPSRVHEHADVTIIFQGGSTTEVAFVDPELRFPYLAGRLLERSIGQRVNAYNAAVSGSFTLDSINALLNKHASLRPTFVVMMEAINDLQTLIFNHNDYYGRVRHPIEEIEQRRGRRTPAVSESVAQLWSALGRRTVPHLMANVAAAIRTARGQSQVPDEFAHVRHEQRTAAPDTIRACFRRNVELYVEIARAFGITPILMTQASRFRDDAPAWQAYIRASIEEKTSVTFEMSRQLHEALNEVLREVGASRQVLVIDLERRMPPQSEFIHDLVHFNSNGSRRAAQIISDEIARAYFPATARTRAAAQWVEC
jgi:GDSL-like Lipase/Acylhydrolase family